MPVPDINLNPDGDYSLLGHLSHKYPVQWQAQSCRLLRSARLVLMPTWAGHDARQHVSRRLLAIITWLDGELSRPFQVVQDGLFIRQITVMGGIRYSVNYLERVVEREFYQNQQWYTYPGSSEELLLPLTRPFWLAGVMENSGLSLPEPEHSPGMTAEVLGTIYDDWDHIEEWLRDTVHTLLNKDPRFQLLREDLHRALQLDPALIELTLRCRINDSGCPSMLYSLVWQHETGLRRVADLCPGLLPLLSSYIQLKKDYIFEAYPFASFRQTLLTDYGLAPATWCYLVQHGSSIFKVLWDYNHRSSRFLVAVSFLQLLQRAFLPALPAPTLLAAFIRIYGDRADDLGGRCNIPGLVIRTIFMEAHERRRQISHEKFMADSIQICQWAETIHPALNKTQIRAGWPYLLRKAREWEQLQLEQVKARDVYWQCAHPVIRLENRVVVPLTTELALLEEGRVMRHCVYRYLAKCIRGDVRFFSIRAPSDGKRLATVGITRNNEGEWRLLDARAFANRPVDQTIINIGMDLANAYPGLACEQDQTEAA